VQTRWCYRITMIGEPVGTVSPTDSFHQMRTASAAWYTVIARRSRIQILPLQRSNPWHSYWTCRGFSRVSSCRKCSCQTCVKHRPRIKYGLVRGRRAHMCRYGRGVSVQLKGIGIRWSLKTGGVCGVRINASRSSSPSRYRCSRCHVDVGSPRRLRRNDRCVDCAGSRRWDNQPIR
jgi:hypothetical protein